MKQMNRKELVMLPAWGIKEIREYFGCGKNKAIDIRNKAIAQHDGAVPYSDKLATTESVLNEFGSTREKELSITRASEGLYGVSIAESK